MHPIAVSLATWSEVIVTEAPRCHWCNRPIDADELIIAIVPVEETQSGSVIEEQPWHSVCFTMIQGPPGVPDDD